MRQDEAVIMAALTGETSKASTNTPRTPAEIASDALECIAAGRDHPQPLQPAPDRESADACIESWRPVMAAHPDTISALHRRWRQIWKKWRYLKLAQRGAIAPLDPGSLNTANRMPRGLSNMRQSSTATPNRYVMGLMAVSAWGHACIYERFLRTVLAYERAGLPARGRADQTLFRRPITGSMVAARAPASACRRHGPRSRPMPIVCGTQTPRRWRLAAMCD